MKFGKKMGSTLAIMTLIVSAIGCSSGSNEQAGSNGNTNASKVPAAVNETNEAVNIRVVWWGSQARHDATQKVLDKYSELNPHVTFQPEFSGWDGYWDKLGVQFSAGNAPDLIQMDAAFLEDYASRGFLADLASINTSDVSQSLVDSGKVNEVLYAMPLGSNALGMVYDKSVVDRLGIKAPFSGWTWDDYYAFVEAAKEKLGEGKSVVGDNSGVLNYNIYQLAQGKGDVFTADGRFNLDKATYIEFLNRTKEWRDTGIIPKADVSASNKEFDPAADLLVNETILLRPQFSAQASSIDSLKPGAYEMVTIPKAAESGGFLKPSMFWSVNEKAAHQEEVKKFVDWFINDEVAAQILGTSRGLPVNNNNLKLLEPEFSDADKMGAQVISDTAAANPQPFRAEPKGWSNFQADYGKVYEKFTFDVIDAEQTYAEVFKLAQQYEASTGK